MFRSKKTDGVHTSDRESQRSAESTSLADVAIYYVETPRVANTNLHQHLTT